MLVFTTLVFEHPALSTWTLNKPDTMLAVQQTTPIHHQSILHLSAEKVVAVLLRHFRFVTVMAVQREVCFSSLLGSMDGEESLSFLQSQTHRWKASSVRWQQS